MPFLDFILDVILAFIPKKWDRVVCGRVLYWGGWFTLKILTFGKIRLAPFKDYLQSERNTKLDWHLFVHARGQRHLKAQTTMLAGVVFWILVGWVVYWQFCALHTLPKII